MLQRAVEDLSSVSTEMGRDALTELCNMMANGFVDEWAALFDTTIDTGSPVPVQDPERTLVARILKQYGVGLFIRSRLRIPRHDVNAAIYVFPGKAEFLDKLSGVGLEVID
ncbi:chemotaxis protein CheC [Halorussus caseinilyticus]|uniref:Chemotaxis protein CheC n=2 Tax=Halorussus caseinilyticus TaxID=3034025 RepID=A0ABD5WJT1_9EURY